MSAADPTLTTSGSGGADDAPLKGWVVPAIIGSALMMQTLNATVISNALPTMAQALQVDPLRLNLAITVYMLATAVFLPVSGWLADKFGARRIFLIAIFLYAASSAACGFAQNLAQLVLFRAMEGAAGAMVGPVGRLVLLRTTPKNELVGAMSVLTMPALVGPVIGPVVGGAIVTFANWRWIFFMNLPIAAAGLVLVRAFVPEIKEQDCPPIDWLGILLTGVGLAVLMFGFENLGRSPLPPLGVAALFVTAFAALGLYWAHAKNTPHAIIDLSVFRLKTFQASVVGGGFFRISMGASPFLLAMLLQIGFGMSAFRAGLMTFISAAGALIMKTTAPPILRRFGFRTVLIVNGLICTAAFMACALFTQTTPHWLIMLALGLGGFFRSLQFTSLNGMVYADLDQGQMSRATTSSTMVQQLVQSVGIGLAASLVHLLMLWRGETQLTAASVSPVFAVVGGVTLVSLFWFAGLPKDAGDEMNNRHPAG